MTRRPSATPVRRRLLIPAVAGILMAPAFVRAELDIQKKAVAVEHKTFDPAHPPEEMPHLEEHGDAVTTTQMDFETAMQVEMSQRVMPNDHSYTTYRIRKVTGKLSCKIVVWLPENVKPQLAAHEEGHREISEYYYKNAEVIARKLADKVDGRRVGAEAPAIEDSEKNANAKVKALNDQLVQSYREAVIAPQNRAQEIYDGLTGHGTKADPDPKKAVKMAIDQQAAEAKAAATKPAKPTTGPSGKPAK